MGTSLPACFHGNCGLLTYLENALHQGPVSCYFISALGPDIIFSSVVDNSVMIVAYRPTHLIFPERLVHYLGNHILEALEMTISLIFNF